MTDAMERLRRSFAEDAEQYHRARPHYPAELVSAVVSGVRAAPRVLEIGCGSGHATRAFAHGASEYVAVDLSASLVAIAERELGGCAHLRFVVGAFEDVVLPKGRFDLIVAAQSFHWLEPVAALAKAHELLVDGGRIALFWRFVRFDGSEFLREARDVILRHAASFEQWPDSSDARFESHRAEWTHALDETGFFTPVRASSFDGSLAHSRATFLDWVGSLSWFRILSEPGKQSLLSELHALRPNEHELDLPVRSLLLTASCIRT